MFSRKNHLLANPYAGFGLTETLVSITAGIVLICASALALNSTRSLINTSTTKANLRQNSSNGTRLLRAEVERSLNVLISSDTTPSGLEHTDLYNSDHEKTLQHCKAIADGQSVGFHPLFGLKMSDVNEPIIYGLSVNASGRGYSLRRCGSPLGMDGRYINNDIQIASVIDEIGTVPCWQEVGTKNCNEAEKANRAPKLSNGTTIKSLNDIIHNLDSTFVDDKTPIREYMEPALRIATDHNRKLIRFIDPNADEGDGSHSYLEKSQAIGRPTTENLYFASYARADKRLKIERENDIVFNGAYFRNVNSKNINFLVDGSGSMSACILWGTGFREINMPNNNGELATVYVRNCSLTRMESLQHELITLLNDLPDDTKITLQSFSSPGGSNHRIWAESKDGSVLIGEPGYRNSAIAFVNSLDDEEDYRLWGNTSPWHGLDFAFSLDENDTLYFLSDGMPSGNHLGRRWDDTNYNSTIQHYLNLNQKRNKPLRVNTISIQLQSDWMEELSGNTSGNYLQIDDDSVISSAN